MRASLLMLVLLAGVARADVPRPAWVNFCVDQMKKQATTLGGDFAKGELHALAEDPPLYCDRQSWMIDYELTLKGVHYAASAGTTDLAGPDVKWHLATMPGQRARAWMKRGSSSLGRIATDAAPGKEVTRFEEAFKSAVDSCLGQAPIYPPASDDPAWTARCRALPNGRSNGWVQVCVRAEKAAHELERMCTWEDEVVGATGRRGRGFIALEQVLELGPDSLPVVERLAKSASPVARIAAARALGMRHSDAGRALLDELAKDSTQAPTRIQDRTQLHSVKEFAVESLKTYPK